VNFIKGTIMSLLVCACFENYAVVGSDSRAVKIEDGRVVQIGDRFCKFWTLDEGRIVVGMTGSFLMSEILSRVTHEIADYYRDSPDSLFAALEYAIPEFVQILSPVVDKYIDDAHRVDDAHRDLGKSVPFLCGYNSSQQQIQAIYWNDLTPERCMGSIVAIGYPEAAELASELISKELGGAFTPGSLALTIKSAIQAAAKDSEYVGGAVRTHVIMTPSFKEKLGQINESCSVSH
jgi:hypothetical protein